ncbi:MAG: GAF domain-containing protein [Smithellaceae bacterium]
MKKSSNQTFLAGKSIFAGLYIAAGLFFILPVASLLYLGIRFLLFNDVFFLAALILTLIACGAGFMVLRVTFIRIGRFSRRVAETIQQVTMRELPPLDNEVDIIAECFRALGREFKNTTVQLDKKTLETLALKELSDLSYMTLNGDYLLFIALERALKIVNADTGSVMMLSRPDKRSFVIKANIGPGDHAKKGTITAFDDSIAKYTVINKCALLVNDIETDPRFGRPARDQYSTKSFICLPLKTSNDIIGVVTISRRRSDVVFTQEDVDVLTPLLSMSAYIYDNINMFQDLAELTRNVKSLRFLGKTLNSSLNAQETGQEIFDQMRICVSFDSVVLLNMIDSSPQKLAVVDFRSFITTNLSRGRTLTYEGTILEKAINEQRVIFIPDVTELTAYIEKKLFGQPDVKTALILPLKVKSQPTGVVVFFNILQKDWTRLSDILSTMGDFLSLALEKDRIIDSLLRRDRVMDSLSLIGHSLTASTFNTEQILSRTMEMIQSVLPVESGYLMMPEADELSFAAAFSLDMQKLKTVKLPRGTGVAGHVFESGVSLMVNNASAFPQFPDIMQDELGFSPRTILCVPIISQGKVNGVISVLNKKEGAFNEADEKMLKAIAASVGTAFENARMYREAVAKSEQPLLLDMEDKPSLKAFSRIESSN